MDNKTISFGTSGVRGRYGDFPFTNAGLSAIGTAIGRWLKQKNVAGQPHIIIGRDTRFSSSEISQIISEKLLEHGVCVTDLGMVPTPVVLWTLKHNLVNNYGIVISASHNPAHDNGIKIFSVKSEFTQADESKIEKHFSDIYTERCPRKTCAWLSEDSSHLKSYTAVVAKSFPDHFLSGRKIVLDCAHGATVVTAPEIFKQLGAEVIVVNGAPDGYNINKNCGATHPECLASTVKKESADIGFAFDGDGDRIFMANRNGEIKDGDDVLAILSKTPEFGKQKVMVGTVMTNEGLAQFMESEGKSLARAAVGERWVLKEMNSQKVSLGGETCGHIMIPSHVGTCDGAFVALKILQAITETNNWELKTFEHMPRVAINMPIARKIPVDADPLKSVIKQYGAATKSGRIVVRYSGTEPLLRLLVEEEHEEAAVATAKLLSKDLEKLLC